MSRLENYGLTFWPCDVDIFEDEKIASLTGEFGSKGESVMSRLLCAIYKRGYFMQWTEMLRKKIAMSIPGVSEGLVDDVVTRLVKWGFFDEAMFNRSQVLTSKAVQERYFDAKKRSKKIETDEFLLIPLPDGFSCKTVTRCYNDATIIPQSISISESNDTPSNSGSVVISSSSSLETRARVFYNSLIPYLSKYDKVMLRKFYNYWSEPNKSHTKMRFELEKTWEVGRRLATWKARDDQGFGGRSVGKGVTVLDAVVSGTGMLPPTEDEQTVFGLLEEPEDGQRQDN